MAKTNRGGPRREVVRRGLERQLVDAIGCAICCLCRRVLLWMRGSGRGVRMEVGARGARIAGERPDDARRSGLARGLPP